MSKSNVAIDESVERAKVARKLINLIFFYLDERMLDSFLYCPVSPLEILGVDDQRRVAGMLLGVSQQLLGGV